MRNRTVAVLVGMVTLVGVLGGPAGANIKYLSQQMGHASVQITLDRYSHLLRDSHPAQAAKLDSLVFDQGVKTEPDSATILQPSRSGGG